MLLDLLLVYEQARAMLPRPTPLTPITELTICIAQAVFPKGNTFILMRDTLGTIFTDLDFAELFPERGQPALSPWPAITNPLTYKGVGGNLVDFALARSYELGYQGRLGLHALPGALGFYRKLRIGLLDCGPDPEEPDNLVYFETLRMDDP